MKKQYEYKTDSGGGMIEAADFEEAITILDGMITEQMIEDGGWGWVDDGHGERFYVLGENYTATT
jgi:hypothetical protein